MRKETIQIYKFEELSKEAQEKAINDRQTINTDFDWWEFMYDDFADRLGKVGIECKNFFFDIYDRTITMDEPSVEDSEKILKSFLTSKEQILFGIENEKIKDEVELKIYEEDGSIYFYYSNDEGEAEEELNNSKYRETINNKLKEKLQTFLKELGKQHDFLMSDEAIKETIIANEYEFLKGGEMF